jgi:uncharacterized membrane protein YeaQ/YmgE (transglycosylase-associated protein family)
MWWLAQVQTTSVTIPAITIPSILVALLIAIIIGFLVQLMVGYTHIGFLGHVIVGIIGALLGSLIASWLNLPTILVVAGIDIVWTFLGSAILVLILTLLLGGSRYRGYFRRRHYYE